jgi:hypothetical protein
MLRRIVPAGALAVLAVVTGLLLAGPAVAATPAEVDGTWGSVDIDGSNQIMMIKAQPSGSFSVLLTDDWATVCRGGPALAVGTGALRGDILSVRYDVRCYNGTPVGPVTVVYTYASATNTLTDSVGVVWIHLAG